MRVSRMTNTYMINVKQIKKDFPIFKTHPDLVYLDSTATSLKPQSVIDEIVEYYSQYSANVHRGIYKISEKATEEFEETRGIVAGFINAPSSEEIIFTRSTTEAINLITYGLGRQIVSEGDEIAATVMEHHSNFVPWQQLSLQMGAVFRVIDITDEGQLAVILSASERSNEILRFTQNDASINLEQYISTKTKILALTYISNVLGTINPVKEIIAEARKINPKIIVVIDAAQASPHHKIDVQDLDCDFLAFSSHKMLGPTGVGVLWGRKTLLEKMTPFNYGGDMVEEVYIDKTIFRAPPLKFEAGTQHISGVIGLKVAIQYLQSIGLEKIAEHEHHLIKLVFERLQEEFGGEINIVGSKDPNAKVALAAFTMRGIHPHDIAHILDEENIAVRVGFHCAMPLHTRLGAAATARASFYIYNDEDDVEKLIGGLKKVRKILT